jgi:hypothetical protein
VAKLMRRQRNQLDAILAGLRRARAYIERNDTVLAIRSSAATTTLHYTRPSDGSVIYPVNKQIGSDIAMLHTGIHGLHQFLECEGK